MRQPPLLVLLAARVLPLGRWADRLCRHSVALAETGWGCRSPVAAPARRDHRIHGAWGNQPLAFAVGRSLGALILLPPTLLMGGTLPLLLAGLREDQPIGGLTGLLYAAISVSLVPPWRASSRSSIGLRETLWWRRRATWSPPSAACCCLSVLLRGRQRPARLPPGPFAMGATSLAYEVLWTRILVFHLGSNVYVDASRRRRCS